jgi:hypothetical protein
MCVRPLVGWIWLREVASVWSQFVAAIVPLARIIVVRFIRVTATSGCGERTNAVDLLQW